MRSHEPIEQPILRRMLATALATLVVFSTAPGAFAGPRGERVVSGNASFARDGVLTTITAGKNAIIAYDSFDIATGETVQFLQPNAAARVLNRISDAHPTQIDGSLLANGRVYLVNSAGVYFGGGAVVDVGALYAAAGAISDADFLARRERFTQLGGSVVNLGSIAGDVVALAGAEVANRGSISAPGGMIALVAGNEVVLVPLGGERVRVRVSGGPATGAATPGVLNAGALDAGAAGEVQLAAGDFYSLAIQQTETGAIRAASTRIEGQAGGSVVVSGAIDATGRRGGDVAVLGEHVRVSHARIDASGTNGGGTILVGGDYQGAPGTRTSQSTTVARSAELRADALASGDGGKVVVWSDGDTRFYGSISARGGAFGGNGGTAETSGKQNLAFDGQVDLGAASGLSGSLLLDPRDIDIVDGAAGTGADDTELDPPTPGTILRTDGGAGNDFSVSKGALAAVTGNILLEAQRDITVVAGAALTLNNQTAGETVTFSADNDIAVNAPIAVNGGSLVLEADANGAGGGNVTIAAAITTGGGDFDSTGTNFTLTGAGSIGAGTGDIRIDHQGDVGIAGALTGDLADIDSGADVALGTLSGLASLDVTAANDITLNGDVTTSGGQFYRSPVVLAADRILTSTGSGAIQFDDTVDSDAGANRDLTVNTAGTTTFGGTVGGNDELDALATDDAGSLVIADDVNTVGSQAYADDTLSLAGTLTDTGTGIALGDEATDALTVTGASTVDVSGATGTLTLAAATTLQDNLSLDAGANALTVSGTVNDGPGASSDLVLDSSAATTISGVIGGSAAIESVTTSNAGSLAIDANVSTTGGQTYNDATQTLAAVTLTDTGTGTIALGNAGTDTLAVNGAATLANSGGGTIDLNTATTLNAGLTVNGGANGVTLDGTIDGAQALALNGSGTIAINAAIGGGTRLTSVASNDGGTLNINAAVSTAGSQSWSDSTIGVGAALSDTGAGGIALGNSPSDALSIGTGASVTTSAGTGDIDIDADATLAANLTLAAGANDITLAGTLDDDGVGGTSSDLALTSSGTTTLNAVIGGASAIESVSSDDGGTLALGANVTTTGGQTYDDGAISLAGATLSDTGAGSVAIGNAAADTLAVTGASTVANSGGGSLALNATTTLGADLTLNAGSGALTIGVAIDDDGVALTSSDLALNSTGTTTISTAIGAGSAIESLTSNDGGTVDLNATVSTTAGQTYNDTTINIAATTLTSTGGGIAIGNAASDTVNFTGIGPITIDTSAGGGAIALNASATLANDLTLTSGAGALTVGGNLNDDGSAITSSDLALSSAGLTTISGDLGGTARLETVTTDLGGTLALTGDVGTNAGQFYNETATPTLGSGGGANTLSDTSANGIAFAATTLTAAGDTTLSTAGGTAAIDLTQATTLAGDLTLDGGANAVTVSGAVNDDGSAGTSSELALNSSGATTISTAIGAGSAIESVATDGAGSLALGANVSTTGGQSYADATQTLSAVTLSDTGAGGITLGDAGGDTLAVNGAATLSNSGGGAIDLNATTTLNSGLTVNGGAGGVTIDGAVDGAQALALNTSGTLAINAAVGAGTALASLTSDDGGTADINAAVRTSGAQTWNDTTIQLGAALTEIGAGGIALGNAASDDLAVTAAATVSTAAGTGDIALNADATLGGNALTLTAGANDITLSGAIDGAGALALNSTGNVAVNAAIGGGTAVTSVASDDGGTLGLGANVTTTGGQTYDDSAITLAGATLSDSGAGSVAVGNAAADSLSVSAASSIANSGGGSLALNATSTLGANLSLNGGGGALTISGAISDDGNGATSSDLALASSGTTTIGAPISVESVASDDPGSLAINASVTTTGGQSYADDTLQLAAALDDSGTVGITLGDAGDALTVTGPSSVSATALGALLALNATTTLAGDLALFAGPNAFTLGVAVNDDANAVTSGDFAISARAVTFAANVGQTSPIESLTVNPGPLATDTIEFTAASAISTTGVLAFNPLGRGPAIDATTFKKNGNLTLTSTGGDVRFGQGEKLTVAGDLAINAPLGEIAVGDLNGVGITLNAGTRILVVGRPPGVASTGDSDVGADFVADSLALNAPDLDVSGGQGLVRFGLPNGGTQGELVDPNNLLGSPFVALAAFETPSVGILPADLLDPVTQVALDFTPGGPAPGSQRPPHNPVAVLLQKPSGGVNVAAASERPLRDSEVSAFLSCDPEDFECQSEAVGEARANSVEAQELRAAFDDLFGPTATADTTALAVAGEDPQRAALDVAVRAYHAQTGQAPTGVAFRQFCQSAPDQVAALRVLDDLRELFTSAREFGMTGEGIGSFKQQTLQQVAPEGIAIDALDAAVEAGALNQ